jgi:hypothetical protein
VRRKLVRDGCRPNPSDQTHSVIASEARQSSVVGLTAPLRASPAGKQAAYPTPLAFKA